LRIPKRFVSLRYLIALPIRNYPQLLNLEEWSNNWDWNDDDTPTKTVDPKNEEKEADNKSQLWLDKFEISISPCANLILIAYKKNLLILQSKLDKQNELEYSLSSRVSFANGEKFLILGF
jgi:hypothetical protein